MDRLVGDGLPSRSLDLEISWLPFRGRELKECTPAPSFGPNVDALAGEFAATAWEFRPESSILAVPIDFFYTGSLLAPGIITGALRTSDSRFVLVW